MADYLSRYVTNDEEIGSNEENKDYIQQEAIPKRNLVQLKDKTVLSLNVATISKAQQHCPMMKEWYTNLKQGKGVTGLRIYKDMTFIKRWREY